MTTSNVRNIDSLEAFREELIRFSGDWDRTLQEVRVMIRKAEQYFAEDRPGYWRRQSQLAERELNEAKDNLIRKRAAIRPADRPAATEAAKRVQAAERRLQTCEAKTREARQWAIEINQHCDRLLGPLADAIEQSESVLPNAASELRAIIDQLRLYAEQSKRDQTE